MRAGFTSLKEGAYSVTAGKPVEDFRTPPADKAKIQQIVYGGFSNCLYSTQRFQADNERKLAVSQDRETHRWFKPLKDAALTWCGHASTHTAKHGGKPWKYALIPDDVVDENMTLDFLVQAGNVAEPVAFRPI